MCFSALMLHGIGEIAYAYEDPMEVGRPASDPSSIRFTGTAGSSFAVACDARKAWRCSNPFFPIGPTATGVPAKLAEYTLKQ